GAAGRGRRERDMRRCVPARGGGQRPPARAVLRRLPAGGAVVAMLPATFLATAVAAGAAVLPGRAAGQPAQAGAGGALLAWGDGANGQLGNGTVTNKKLPTPVKLPATTKITQVRAGCFHTVALTSTGQVLAWGGNNRGQLGNGTTTDSTTPVKVTLPS